LLRVSLLRCRGRVVDPSRRVHTLVGNNRYKSKLGHVAYSSRSCFPTKLIISHKLASRAFPCELSRARCIRGCAKALREIQPSTVHLIMRSLTRTTCTRACEGSYVRASVCLPFLCALSLSLSLSLSLVLSLSLCLPVTTQLTLRWPRGNVIGWSIGVRLGRPETC